MPDIGQNALQSYQTESGSSPSYCHICLLIAFLEGAFIRNIVTLLCINLIIICFNDRAVINPYLTAFPYVNGMVLHFYQQQESSTTKTVHKVVNKGLKTYV